MHIASTIQQVRENESEARNGAVNNTANDDRDHNMRKTDSVQNQLANIIEDVFGFSQKNANGKEIDHVL